MAYLTFNLPFAIWIMNAFFAELPKSLEEAAMVDGASRWKAFRDIALPLVLPGIATTAILCLVFSWNDYAFAVTFSGPEQPDAADRRVAARDADLDRLGPAHGDRDDRGGADDPGRARSCASGS